MDFSEDRIWKEIFFKDDFSVDLCLSRYTQKTDLKTLRQELREYGLELHNCMSDILKCETEDIVNLAENLTNLKSKIEDLSSPLSQLVEEIRKLHDIIQNTQSSFNAHLEAVKANNVKHAQLVVKLGLVSTSGYVEKILKSQAEDCMEDLIFLERAVGKYSFQTAYLQELGLSSGEVDIHIDGLERKLIDLVNCQFLLGVDKRDPDLIARCMRMYVNLNQQAVAELTYKESVVRPALNEIFSVRSFEKHHHEVCALYEEAIGFLNANVSQLLEVEKICADLHGFSFILNSFWPEVDRQIRENLPNITAPGNPKLFQKRFCDTWRFLKEIAEHCSDSDFLQHPTCQDHLKRFNLAVYFEIRFQQIAGRFEKNITDNFGEAANGDYKLRLTEELLGAFSKCFRDDVFLDHIADQMLRLAMLLLSRYLKWFESYLQSAGGENLENQKRFLVSALIDFQTLKSQIGSEGNGESKIYAVLFPQMKDLALEFCLLNDKLIDSSASKIEDYIVKLIAIESTTNLQQVTSIPRLYRRTNRNIPKECSGYVKETVLPVIHFGENYKPVMKGEDIMRMLDVTILKITEQYITLVQEVLSSVCKMEESLRRLKNRSGTNEEASNFPNGETISDEAKIRKQIQLDVDYYANMLKMYSAGVSKKAIETLIDVTRCTD